MILMIDIHVRSFTGSSLRPYLHSLAKLRMEVLREYPYLEEPNLYREMQYLRKVATCKESIVVLIFDNTTLVGASLGYPLSVEEDVVLKPFIELHRNTSTYFFFGDSLLLKNYRSRGIGHHFFDAREAHVQHNKKYKHICFYTPDYPDNDPKPKDYIPLLDFWRKRGYIHHPEMKCHLPWKEEGDACPSLKQMSFWIKDLA